MGDDSSSAPVVIRPAGFPACRRCPYLHRDEPLVCWRCCAQRSIAPPGRLCLVCEQTLGSDAPCTNDWCTRADRWFSIVWSVGPHAGTWRRAIVRYKYRDMTGWAQVFGRVLLGYLDEHMPWFDEYDLLLPMPAYTGPGARRPWDHVGAFVAAAARLAGPRWPFVADLLAKRAETPPLARRPLPARRACAEGPLRRALEVVDPAAVAGCRVLVIDDVFTEGSTLREVARALILAGADEVAGLVLARQPWQPLGTDAGHQANGGRPAPTVR